MTKRAGFTSVQNAQTISVNGAVVAPVRTGAEGALAHRCGSMFAITAAQDGTISKLVDGNIVLTYKDGTSQTYQIGRRFGVMAGTTMVHDLITDMQEGQAVKQGDVVAWNEQFFERDPMNPRQVLYKMVTMARTVLNEVASTFEDGCALSPSFAKKMEYTKGDIRKIRVKFDREIRGLVRTGQAVTGDSILCTIENPLGADNSLIYDDASRATLADISSASPKSGHDGVVDLVEVLYNGDMEDMSESLRKIVEASNRQMSRTAKLRGESEVNGRVANGYSVDGTAIATDEAVIKVYITGTAGMGVGDKLAFDNQLKSIVSENLVGTHKSEDGQSIDAFFSYSSSKNRVVESSMVIDTASTLLIEGAKQFIAAYRGKQ